MEEKDYIQLFDRYISHQTTKDEETLLVEWVRNNPRLLQHIEEEIGRMPDVLEEDIVRRNLDKIYEVIAPQMKSKKEKAKIVSFYSHLFIKIAVVLLLPLLSALTVYFVMNNQHPSDQPLSVTVSRGQKAQVQLPDGTLVWLNSNSNLRYTNSYNNKERRVCLEGEGFFEVMPNKQVPFRVEVKDMMVEALGTSFVIKSYPEDDVVYTVLNEGKVKVTTPLGETLMSPNDCFEYNRKNNTYEVKTVYDAKDYIGWVSDRIHFENATFAQIMQDIRRVYDVDIQVLDSSLMYKRFTGSIPNNGVEGILKCIQYSVPFTYIIDQNKIIIQKQ